MTDSMSDDDKKILKLINEAIDTADVPGAAMLLQRHSHIIYKKFDNKSTCSFIDVLLEAAIINNKNWLVEVLLTMKVNINAKTGPSSNEGMIESAARGGNVELVKRFLDMGGVFTQELNGRRTSISLIGAIQVGSLEIVRMLVERGAPVDSMAYQGFASALDYAGMYQRTEIAEYLISKGARPGWQIRGEPAPPVPQPHSGTNLREHLADAMIGEVRDRELTPIVPTDPPVTLILAEDQNLQAFVTNGVSGRYLPNSDDPEFELVELFLQLDSFKWPCGPDGIVLPDQCWPLQWMFRLAGQLHAEQWEVRPDTTIETGSPLGPDTRMTAWWFVDEQEHWSTWTREDGSDVRILRMVPIYPEEIKLIRREGGIELIRRFAANDLTTVLDPHRPNFA